MHRMVAGVQIEISIAKGIWRVDSGGLSLALLLVLLIVSFQRAPARRNPRPYRQDFSLSLEMTSCGCILRDAPTACCSFLVDQYNYLPSFFLNASVRAGTIVNRSPTTP